MLTTELEPCAYVGSSLDLSLFDDIHWSVVSFLVVD